MWISGQHLRKGFFPLRLLPISEPLRLMKSLRRILAQHIVEVRPYGNEAPRHGRSPRGGRVKVIFSIQSLRALAALAVVVVHAADGAAANSGNRHFGEVASIGAAGVDVFFVISGFIMYVTACSRPITPQRFLLDRFSRIVPLYWVATFLLMAVLVVGKAPIPDIRYLLASLALVPVDPLPYLGVGWTLVYEMFFYALLAAALIWRPRHLGASGLDRCSDVYRAAPP